MSHTEEEIKTIRATSAAFNRKLPDLLTCLNKLAEQELGKPRRRKCQRSFTRVSGPDGVCPQCGKHTKIMNPKEGWYILPRHMEAK